MRTASALITCLIVAVAAGSGCASTSRSKSPAEPTSEKTRPAGSSIREAAGDPPTVASGTRPGPLSTAAASWLRGACEAGSGFACLELGTAHELGRGLPRDMSRAWTLYEAACEGGALDGCVRLGRLTLPSDVEAARDWFRDACVGGDLLGCWHLLRLALRDGAPKEAYAQASSTFVESCEETVALAPEAATCEEALETARAATTPAELVAGTSSDVSLLCESSDAGVCEPLAAYGIRARDGVGAPQDLGLARTWLEAACWGYMEDRPCERGECPDCVGGGPTHSEDMSVYCEDEPDPDACYDEWEQETESEYGWCEDYFGLPGACLALGVWLEPSDLDAALLAYAAGCSQAEEAACRQQGRILLSLCLDDDSSACRELAWSGELLPDEPELTEVTRRCRVRCRDDGDPDACSCLEFLAEPEADGDNAEEGAGGSAQP